MTKEQIKEAIKEQSERYFDEAKDRLHKTFLDLFYCFPEMTLKDALRLNKIPIDESQIQPSTLSVAEVFGVMDALDKECGPMLKEAEAQINTEAERIWDKL